ncbi:hypothetical protein AB0878_06070 [Amycolatopsis sp. NPDC047767]|uniref:hypothetical protein n=1 Tax=Amycolatopsis sp. NPDC047767 TaxID=3156765 RepID=UPI003453FE77
MGATSARSNANFHPEQCGALHRARVAGEGLGLLGTGAQERGTGRSQPSSSSIERRARTAATANACRSWSGVAKWMLFDATVGNPSSRAVPACRSLCVDSIGWP